VSTSESVRRLHGEPFVGHWEGLLPDVVVFAETREEVSDVLAFANARGIPVVPFGAGSSAEGEIVPLHGGISLDLTRLTAIEIRPGDLQATVGAGVTRSALGAAAGEHGLWFPVDPGADATLGGMTATNASGTTTVRYGSMRQNVLELEVVLADGRIVRAGSRTVKTSAGYNLVHLFIGSEGTLGVITQVTVRLYGIPEHLVAVRAAFPDLDDACACATALVGAGVSVLRTELLDRATIAAINAFKGSALAERPHLFIELGGSRAGVEGDLEAAREIAEAHDCESFDASSDPTERARLWAARHDVAFALAEAHKGKTIKGTDTCVPVSQLPDAVRHARRVMQEAGLEPSVLGHVGDGNYHVMFAIDEDDPASVARVKAADQEIVRDCLARGGTCSGEHGIGIGKMSYLEQEHGDLLPLMRGLKGLLDPNGILNPGKIFAPEQPGR
jgi:D-lactate dehydrogenase (cytochrome)